MVQQLSTDILSVCRGWKKRSYRSNLKHRTKLPSVAAAKTPPRAHFQPSEQSEQSRLQRGGRTVPQSQTGSLPSTYLSSHLNKTRAAEASFPQGRAVRAWTTVSLSRRIGLRGTESFLWSRLARLKLKRRHPRRVPSSISASGRRGRGRRGGQHRCSLSWAEGEARCSIHPSWSQFSWPFRCSPVSLISHTKVTPMCCSLR